MGLKFNKQCLKEYNLYITAKNKHQAISLATIYYTAVSRWEIIRLPF